MFNQGVERDYTLESDPSKNCSRFNPATPSTSPVQVRFADGTTDELTRKSPFAYLRIRPLLRIAARPSKIHHCRVPWTFTYGKDAQVPPTTAITSLHHGAKRACHGYQRNPLTLLMPAKNRTTVELRSRRRSRLATTALLGLAPVRSARALPPTTEETSALASLMTWVKQTIK